VQKRDSKAVATLASGSSGKVLSVSFFQPPSADEAESDSASHGLAVVVVVAATESDASRAIAAIDSLIASRFPATFAVVRADRALISALASTTRAAAATSAEPSEISDSAAGALPSLAALQSATGATVSADVDNGYVVAYGTAPQVSRCEAVLSHSSSTVPRARIVLVY
jgi:type II secretory pathway component GspD/PulD (secretin)